jgi:hypothetical protein
LLRFSVVAEGVLRTLALAPGVCSRIAAMIRNVCSRAIASDVIINGLPAGPHKILIELVNANHQTLDQGVVNFVIPEAK